MFKNKRTHTCGELRQEHVGHTVVLNGWVEKNRDHGGLVFADLRDRYGKTQVMFDPDNGREMFELAQKLRGEYVVAVRGQVVARPEGTRNPKLPTGDIEVRAAELELLNRSEPPPFEISSPEAPNEDIRLKYRYLDLRRPAMQRAIFLRHRLNATIRNYLDAQGFVEVETPILAKSTPEGARDYLVPSRVQNGSFYALPQSPQLFKQILMVAGYDKYYQIARCFRDEDLRANRQPEFTQLDFEMSFVDREDVLRVIEGLCADIMSKVMGRELKLPLPRLTYAESMRRFGCDSPDLRYGMELQDISDLARQSEFMVFRNVVEAKGQVRGLCAKGAASYSRKQIDELAAFVGNYGAKGLAWCKVEEQGLSGGMAKNFPATLQQAVRERMGAAAGDLLLFVADQPAVANAALSVLREKLAAELKLYDPTELHFSWVLDFPLLEWDKDEKRWGAAHHPFTMPHREDLDRLESHPGSVRAYAHDLIINGEEAAGGTIRCHDPVIQRKIFNLLGLTPQDVQNRFGFFIEALQYGAPPHGGIAFGLDRWVMLLSGYNNIRDVIAFPKTQRAADLMTGAPSPVDERQLRDLGIRLAEPPAAP
jgi:aspartyl-tRNA synthetase